MSTKDVCTKCRAFLTLQCKPMNLIYDFDNTAATESEIETVLSCDSFVPLEIKIPLPTRLTSISRGNSKRYGGR